MATLHDCERELTRVTNGLAHLDHMFTEAVQLIDLYEARYEAMELEALKAIGEIPKGTTATVVTAKIRSYFAADDERQSVIDNLREHRSTLKLIERWYRSLEKRASNAQSAQKKHLESPGRFGGE